MLYRIVDFTRLRAYSHIIWDIDGTITDEYGHLDNEVAAKIINLGLSGIYHSFITGRDRAWAIANVIDPMKEFWSFPRAHDSMTIYAEVGCLPTTVDAAGKIHSGIDPDVENHPLRTNVDGIRDSLKALVYNPDELTKYEVGADVTPPHEVIYDANDVGWVVDRAKGGPSCHPYIWSTTKEVLATLEKVRTREGKWRTFDQSPYIESIRKLIVEKNFANHIDIEEIATAINIVPKVGERKLGKSWAAGKALLNIWEHKLGKRIALEEVIGRSIAVGDGRADLDFATPTFAGSEFARLEQGKKMQIIFVGDESDLPPVGSTDYHLRENILIQGTGLGELAFDRERDSISLRDAVGARVVSQVLDVLQQWGYFQSF